jgi:hypothetical protein
MGNVVLLVLFIAFFIGFVMALHRSSTNTEDPFVMAGIGVVCVIFAVITFFAWLYTVVG